MKMYVYDYDKNERWRGYSGDRAPIRAEGFIESLFKDYWYSSLALEIALDE